jgi:hypothetical protein
VTEIRGLLSKDEELGELKRDIQTALKKVPPFEIKEVGGEYTEPMYILHKTKPQGVLLLSCIDAREQENPENVLTGGFCHSTWDGARSRIRINSIDGFTPDPTVLYRFTFMVVG